MNSPIGPGNSPLLSTIMSSVNHARTSNRATRSLQNRYFKRGDDHRADTTESKTASKAPLTHFICLPIGHHAELRKSMSSFTSSLLVSDPPIAGLDQSIVIPPRRLHLTLGVMSLASDQPPSETSASQIEPGVEPTLERANAVLQSLRPRILNMLNRTGSWEPLRVALDHVDVLQLERGGDSKNVRAHVLFAGPDMHSEGARRLKSVCDEIHKTFKGAGLLIADRRDLKLHCTVLNTTYRKPRPRGARVPFSYSAIHSSTALVSTIPAVASLPQSSSQTTTSSSHPGSAHGKHPNNAILAPVPVSLGSWTIDEIQICRMGSWGPQGEYVAEARCSIQAPP